MKRACGIGLQVREMQNWSLLFGAAERGGGGSDIVSHAYCMCDPTSVACLIAFFFYFTDMCMY